MAAEENEIRSYAEDFEILYNLKSLVQKQRSGDLSVKSKDVFDGYKKAVLIAAEETGKTEAEIFDELMSPIRKKLEESVTETAVASPIALPKGLEGLFDEAKLKALNEIIKKVAQNQAEEQKINAGGNKTAKSKTAAEPIEEDSLMTRLKAEAIAGLDAAKLALSEADKKKYAEIIRNASELKVKRIGLKCEISFPEMNVTPSFNMTGKVGALSQTVKNGQPSSYGNLSAENVSEPITIGEKKTKTIKTKSKTAAEASPKK